MTTQEYNNCVTSLADDLYRYAARLCNDTEVGKDIVQEVFEKIWRKRRNIRSNEAKNYLFKSTFNTSMDHLRRLKLSRAHVESQRHAEVSSTGGLQFELQDFIHKALDKISELHRSLILLRDYEGYSYKEIGDITGLNESQVKVYIFRGRKALKSLIQEVNYYE